MVTGDAAICPTCGQAYPPTRGHCATDGTKLVVRLAQAASLTGRIVAGKYAVGPMLGEGVLGAVYAAKQYAIDREVALKAIKPSLVADPVAAERLYYAASAACALSGPAVATGIDVGRADDGLIYVVQELVRGRSLATILATTRIPNYQCVAIAINICDALATAHQAQLAHGDLKPSNVFVLDDDRGAKVADFALARALQPDAWAVAPELALYAAPELGDGALPDARSDLYSLGCILYHVLAGKPPFGETSTRLLLEKHRRETAARLPREVPPALAAIVLRLLAKRPDERFASARDVRAALLPMSPTASAPASPAFTYNDAPSGPNASGPRTGAFAANTSVTPKSGNIYHPKTGAHAQPMLPGNVNANVSGIYHPKTGGHTQPPPFAPPAAPPVVAPVAPEPAPASSKRVLVIAIVAIALSGGGVLAYLAATGAL